MASFLYFKFRSQLSYSTITFDGHFVSVGEAKKLIAAKQGMPEGAAEDLVLTNAQAGSEYKDDSEQVPKGTSILVRRMPAGAAHRGRLRALVGATPAPTGATSAQSNRTGPSQQQTGAGATAATDVDEFGGDPLKKQAEALKAQEEAARQAAAAAAAQMRASQLASATGGREGPGRGMQHGGRGGRGSRVPYPNYICPRCTAIGKHWESDCPTQNDPAYDVKRVRPPAGIPKGKIAINPEGDYLLADGTLGQIASNSAAYRAMAAQMQGLPTEPDVAAAQTGAGDVLALPAPQPTLAIEASPGQVPNQQTAAEPQAGITQQAAVAQPQSNALRVVNLAQPTASPQRSQPPPSPGSLTNSRLQQPAVSLQQPATSLQQPATILQQPSISVQQPAVSQLSQQQPPLTHQADQQGQQQPASTQLALQPPATAASSVQAAAITTAPAPTQPASAPGLFDDDEDVLQAATQQVKLAASTAAPNEASAAVGPLHAAEPTGSVGTVSKRSASPTLSEGEMQIRAERTAIPTELCKPVFSSVHDFLDRLPLFHDELPVASMKLLVKAFGAGLPLTPTEFQRLQESERKAQQKADSKAPARSSRLGRDREGGSARDRGRGRSREGHDRGREGRRSRSQSRSHSPRDRSRSKEHSKGRSRRTRIEDLPPTAHVSRSNRVSKDGKASRDTEGPKDSGKAAVKDSKPRSKDSKAAKDSTPGKAQTQQVSRDSRAGAKAAGKPSGLPAASDKAAKASKEACAAAQQEDNASKAVNADRVSHGSKQQPVAIREAKQGGDTKQQADADGVAGQQGAIAGTGVELVASGQARSHDMADEKEADRSSSQHTTGSLQEPDALPASSGASRGSSADADMAVASAHDAAAITDKEAVPSGSEATGGEDADAEKLTPQKRKSSSKSHEDRKHKKQKMTKKHKDKEREKEQKDASRKHRSQRASEQRSPSPSASEQLQPSRSRSRSHSQRTRSPSPEQVRGRKDTHDHTHASPCHRSPTAAASAAAERPAPRAAVAQPVLRTRPPVKPPRARSPIKAPRAVTVGQRARSPVRAPRPVAVVPRARSPVKAPHQAVVVSRHQPAAEVEPLTTRAALPARLAGRLVKPKQVAQEASQPTGQDAARKRRSDMGALPIHGRMGANSDEEEKEPAGTGKVGRWVHDRFEEQQGTSAGSARVKRMRG